MAAPDPLDLVQRCLDELSSALASANVGPSTRELVATARTAVGAAREQNAELKTRLAALGGPDAR